VSTIIVIPCSKQKLALPALVHALYTGPHFKAALAWARTVARDERIIVLSALHGLVRLNESLPPYDYTMANRRRDGRWVGARPPLPLGTTAGRIVSVCGAEYDAWLRPDFNPVRGLGIGERLAWFKMHAGILPVEVVA
jgi:hypothetical protein